jgi:hypothetical protein
MQPARAAGDPCPSRAGFRPTCRDGAGRADHAGSPREALPPAAPNPGFGLRCSRLRPLPRKPGLPPKPRSVAHGHLRELLVQAAQGREQLTPHRLRVTNARCVTGVNGMQDLRHVSAEAADLIVQPREARDFLRIEGWSGLDGSADQATHDLCLRHTEGTRSCLKAGLVRLGQDRPQSGRSLADRALAAPDSRRQPTTSRLGRT